MSDGTSMASNSNSGSGSGDTTSSSSTDSVASKGDTSNGGDKVDDGK